MATQHTILDEMRSAGPATAGFHYLRIGLATAVLTWHSIVLSTGSTPLDQALWSGPFRFLPAAILPMFFAVSGFLVSASLERSRLHQFLALRVLRIVPALAVVVVLSALILVRLTTPPLRRYFTSPEFGGFFSYRRSRTSRCRACSSTTLTSFHRLQPNHSVEFQCYAAQTILALLNLCAIGALAQIIVLAALAATLHALLLSPVSPFDHVPGGAHSVFSRR